MKKVIALLVILLALSILAGCGNQSGEPASNENSISVQEWLDSKGGTESSTMTVTVKTIVNPVLAIVEDGFGTSVNLFGVMVDGEFMEFEKAGISQGDTIVIRGGKYNEYEGNVEIAEAALVEIK
ncbi:MAG: hypothetical protein IJE43_08030 [Alphaproteobacteria bacterium]|nr:hypothetical protein [Alphaproteobacteria bacterium]